MTDTSTAHAAEASARWPEQYDVSQRRLSALSDTERRELFARGTAIDTALGALCTSGVSPDDVAVQDLVAEHYAWVSAFWTPNREAYVGLGRLYVDDSRFASHYDDVAPGLAAFLCAAIERWAPAHLAD